MDYRNVRRYLSRYGKHGQALEGWVLTINVKPA